jgi:hypothetical protein
LPGDACVHRSNLGPEHALGRRFRDLGNFGDKRREPEAGSQRHLGHRRHLAAIAARGHVMAVKVTAIDNDK